MSFQNFLGALAFSREAVLKASEAYGNTLEMQLPGPTLDLLSHAVLEVWSEELTSPPGAPDAHCSVRINRHSGKYVQSTGSNTPVWDR